MSVWQFYSNTYIAERCDVNVLAIFGVMAPNTTKERIWLQESRLYPKKKSTW